MPGLNVLHPIYLLWVLLPLLLTPPCSYYVVTVYLLLYVDDIIITGNDSSTITTIISQLSTAFELKDFGSPMVLLEFAD